MRYSISLNFISKRWQASCHDDWHGWFRVAEADRVIVPAGSECVTEWRGYQRDQFVGGFLEISDSGLTVDGSGVMRFSDPVDHGATSLMESRG